MPDGFSDNPVCPAAVCRGDTAVVTHLRVLVGRLLSEMYSVFVCT